MLFTSVDFQKPGKQQGFLQVPYSHNLGGWANVMIPVTTIANGSGPTVLILRSIKVRSIKVSGTVYSENVVFGS